MYEILIGSFMKESHKALGGVDAKTIQILVESIKTRNAMALRRFESSLQLINMVNDFNAELTMRQSVSE